MEETVPWEDDNLSVYGRIALEYGLRFTAMQRDWATRAVDQLDRRSGDLS